MEISNNQSWYVNPNTRYVTSNVKNTAIKDKEVFNGSMQSLFNPVEISSEDNPYDTESYLKAQKMADSLAALLRNACGNQNTVAYSQEEYAGWNEGVSDVMGYRPCMLKFILCYNVFWDFASLISASLF